MSFPSTSDYALAVRYPERFVLDPLLRKGRAVLGRDGEPLVYSGGFARVFVFDCADGRRYALRCWTADSGDSFQTYREAHLHLRRVQLPHFADFALTSPGIVAGGRRVPTVRMSWVEGDTLKDFLSRNRRHRLRLAHVRTRLVAACAALHAHGIAHGDLQPDNLKLTGVEGAEELVFIDYDTLHVPALTGTPRVNDGLPAYQHPARSAERTAQPHDDYFSELVLYITLLAIERQPALWEKYRIEERDKELLFNEADYRAPDRSPLLADVERIDGELAAYIAELRAACRVMRLSALDPLEKIVARVVGGKVPPRAPTPAVSTPGCGGSVFAARLRGVVVTAPASPITPMADEAPPEFTQTDDEAAAARVPRTLDWDNLETGAEWQPSATAGPRAFAQRVNKASVASTRTTAVPPPLPHQPPAQVKRLGIVRSFILWLFLWLILGVVFRALPGTGAAAPLIALLAASVITGMVAHAYRDTP